MFMAGGNVMTNYGLGRITEIEHGIATVRLLSPPESGKKVKRISVEHMIPDAQVELMEEMRAAIEASPLPKGSKLSMWFYLEKTIKDLSEARWKMFTAYRALASECTEHADAIRDVRDLGKYLSNQNVKGFNAIFLEREVEAKENVVLLFRRMLRGGEELTPLQEQNYERIFVKGEY